MDKILDRNKKINYEYEIIKTYSCGIVLLGSEVKMIKNHFTSINQSYCYINKGEVFIKNMYIAKPNYIKGGYDSYRERKLLLTKNEIKRISTMLNIKGYTLIPKIVLLNDKNMVKIMVCICKGKKNYDKRQDNKIKDLNRELKINNLK